MLIFRWKRWTDLLIRNCPTGSIGHLSPNGRIDQDLFVMYLQHFVTFTKSCETNTVLLVIDGHQSHKSLWAVEFARQNVLHYNTDPSTTFQLSASAAGFDVLRPSEESSEC